MADSLVVYNTEEEQIDMDRNNLVFLLLIVVTLMMMCTFLFAFFVLDNFRNVPCDVNRATGPPGPQGIQGVPGKDNFETGAKGLTPTVPSRFVGKQGDTGFELTGETGDITPLGTGYVGPIGKTGDTGPAAYDGLVTFGLIFGDDPNGDSRRLNFYSETELLARVTAPSFTTERDVFTRVVLIRMGSLVTLNVYPFLIFREIEKVGAQGPLSLDIFTAGNPLSEYSPPRQVKMPVIVSKFTIINSGDGLIQKATQTNVDSPGLIEIVPNSGTLLYGDWTSFGEIDGNVPDPSKILFKSDDSPFGLEGVISVPWLLDAPS